MSISAADSKVDHDSEKYGANIDTHPGDVEVLSDEFVEIKETRKGLHQRHVQMIALAGTLGTGLFLSSGQAIQRGGPLGALLGYSVMGTVAIGTVFAAAEMGALMPLNGGIIRYAEHFVDPALSFADGWNQIYAHIVSVPAEVSAAAVIIQYWTSASSAIFITVLGLLMLGTTLLWVRFYGELEYGFSILKILLVIGLNFLALVITTGGAPNHEAIGFKYWGNPGPFTQFLGIDGALGRFLGFYRVLNSSLYAYSGIENITLTAGETQSPRKSIPMAARRIFWKILIFYVVTIFFVGLIVPSDDPNLLHTTGDAAQSPFVIAATLAGIKVVPSIINAVVLTSAWSAGNSILLWGSRSLYGMAHEGRVPKIFTRTNRFGVPHYSALFYGVFIGLAYLSLSSSASEAFNWLQDLVSISTLVNWLSITTVYLRLYYACQKQSISRDRLPWAAPLQPYLTWWAFSMQIILLITGGFSTFIHGQWSTETFISSYINIPIFIILYFGFKIVKRSKIVPLDEVPIQHYLDIAQSEKEQEQEVEEPRKSKWGWLTILWA
ncbi:amino acid permease/ SLC12A domain-containing protein [Astrocystis sublimbata]|nr:amino acid permease/ SLC12A domain-containing protein [Astrocystis sublimbata]KAI0187383.1 amino acid permease/ SLC12A domain-containing protein [Astrocystis sublimbata]KAI0187384.1 amino acid permease/ SLC12A domain-containing protein [Astrocystis sublimbata]KAI0203420.1 amino acid permease/ SLC12A domain-containing protein [Astrocystis sublimbata]KAI0203421.1 amino acid permease/ SLC12A domain-containing protein [Astrocystis sublimbata]